MGLKSKPQLMWHLCKLSIFLSLSTTTVLCWKIYDTHLQAQRHRRDWETLTRVELARLTDNYQFCISEAQQISPESVIRVPAQAVLQLCQNGLAKSKLEQAKELAANNQIERAIGVANSVPAASSYHSGALEYVEVWSAQVLELAQRYYLDSSGQLNLAVTTASSIPENCSIYPTAQRHIQEWQQTWDTNQRHWQAAKVSADMNDLEMATAELAQMVDHPYWNLQAQLVVEQLSAKQQQYQTLSMEAQQDLWQDDLEAATEKINQLPTTGVWGEERTKLSADLKDAYHERQEPDTKPAAVLVGILMFVLDVVAGIGALRR